MSSGALVGQNPAGDIRDHLGIHGLGLLVLVQNLRDGAGGGWHEQVVQAGVQMEGGVRVGGQKGLVTAEVPLHRQMGVPVALEHQNGLGQAAEVLLRGGVSGSP